MRLQLLPHDPAWHRQFADLVPCLQRCFAGGVPDLEHIGSTAVPGLTAKPVLDVMAGVDDLDAARAAAPALAAEGFVYRPEHEAVLPDRRYFVRGEGATLRIHLHVVRRNGLLWRQHLLFRDALRASSPLRDAYGRLKQVLVERHARAGQGKAAYTAAKAPFIQSVLAGWAAPDEPAPVAPMDLHGPPSLHMRRLGQVPHLRALVCGWLQAEWPGWYGPEGPGDLLADVAAFAGTGAALPVGLVVFSDGEPIGFGALKAASIDSHRHLSPWAAAGFVVPGHRGRGVGAFLLQSIVDQARAWGAPRVYCGTGTARSLLQRAGWECIDEVTHAGTPMRIFRSPA